MASFGSAVQVLNAVCDSVLGRLVVSSNAKRNGGVLHRNAVASADTLAVPGTLVLSDITEAGSTLANVAYHALVSAGNRWGPTGVGADPGTITPTATHAVRIALTPVTGADYYDVFLSTAVNPLWVGRITAAQLVTGDRIISTVGVVSARGGATVANTIDVGIVGTGLASNVNPFAVNNAYVPNLGTITPINCTGFSRAILHVQLAVTDLRSLPTLVLTPFFQDQTSSGDWFADRTQTQTMTLLAAAGQTLEQQFPLTVDGATNLAVLVQSITGQGAAATIWVELA